MHLLLNLLLISRDKQKQIQEDIKENIYEANNFENLIQMFVNHSIDIVVIFQKDLIENPLDFVSYIEFINSNFNQKEKFFILITSNQESMPQTIYKLPNTYLFNESIEKPIKYSSIIKQIDLIKRGILMQTTKNYYEKLLSESKNSLILNYTLNSIHALIKENLNILSLKNGKYFLNDIMKIENINEHQDLERLLLCISKQINIIDSFINEENEESLSIYLSKLEHILNLYYRSYEFVFIKELQTSDHKLNNHVYIILTLLIIHIVTQKISHAHKIKIKIATSYTKKQLQITISFNTSIKVKFEESNCIKLCKSILDEHNQKLTILDSTDGYTFSILV